MFLHFVFNFIGLKKRHAMKTISIAKFRKNFHELIDIINKEKEPILIVGKRGNAILLSEEDWRAINETLYLVSIPGMMESIVKGMKEPLDKI